MNVPQGSHRPIGSQKETGVTIGLKLLLQACRSQEPHSGERCGCESPGISSREILRTEVCSGGLFLCLHYKEQLNSLGPPERSSQMRASESAGLRRLFFWLP